MKLQNIDTAIEDIIDFLDLQEDIDRASIKRTALSVLKKLPMDKFYLTKVKLLQVREYKTMLPNDLHKLINLGFKDTTPNIVNRERIVEWVTKQGECDIVISLECPNCTTVECSCESPEVILDLDDFEQLRRPQLDYTRNPFMTNWGGGINPGRVNTQGTDFRFELAVCTNSNWFGEVDGGCRDVIPENPQYEYRIEDKILRFNRKEGQIIIAYESLPVDANGSMMIPDIEDVYESIKWANIAKMAYRKFSSTRDNSYMQEYRLATVEREKFMGRARARLHERDYNTWAKQAYAFFGKHMPVEDMHGNVTDHYDTVMDRLSRK